ncbi:hypothetical protein L7F22_015882 [Adiantum nelumboides]|nr:hypothetical protein [Adiantum nelumboides]
MARPNRLPFALRYFPYPQAVLLLIATALQLQYRHLIPDDGHPLFLSAPWTHAGLVVFTAATLRLSNSWLLPSSLPCQALGGFLFIHPFNPWLPSFSCEALLNHFLTQRAAPSWNFLITFWHTLCPACAPSALFKTLLCMHTKIARGFSSRAPLVTSSLYSKSLSSQLAGSPFSCPLSWRTHKAAALTYLQQALVAFFFTPTKASCDLYNHMAAPVANLLLPTGSSLPHRCPRNPSLMLQGPPQLPGMLSC